MQSTAKFCIITLMNLAQKIKSKAVELGFDLVGITDASPIDTEQVEFLAGWLKSGYAGRMSYLHQNPYWQAKTIQRKLMESDQKSGKNSEKWELQMWAS